MMPFGEPIAVLSRDVAIRVLNCSASGCLIECRSPLDVGTIGSMRLTWEGVERVEDVRVTRCQAIAGGSRFHVGVQFLATSSAGVKSLRRAFRLAGDLAAVSGQMPM